MNLTEAGAAGAAAVGAAQTVADVTCGSSLESIKNGQCVPDPLLIERDLNVTAALEAEEPATAEVTVQSQLQQAYALA